MANETKRPKRGAARKEVAKGIAFNFDAKTFQIRFQSQMPDMVGEPFEIEEGKPGKKNPDQIWHKVIIDGSPFMLEQGMLVASGIESVCDEDAAENDELVLVPGAVITVQNGSMSFQIK